MITPATLISVAIFLGPSFLLLGLLYLYRWYRKRKGLKTPLTRPLLRGPGESLRSRIQEATDAIKAAGVGPRQALKFMGQFQEKEVLSRLRMAILGSKSPRQGIFWIEVGTRKEPDVPYGTAG
jgi:hypothetical protein